MIVIPGPIPLMIHPFFWLFAILIGWIMGQSVVGTLVWVGIIDRKESGACKIKVDIQDIDPDFHFMRQPIAKARIGLQHRVAKTQLFLEERLTLFGDLA